MLKAGAHESYVISKIVIRDHLLKQVALVCGRPFQRLSLKRGTGNRGMGMGNGNGEWERGMGTGNLRGMTGESAENLFLGIIEQ